MVMVMMRIVMPEIWRHSRFDQLLLLRNSERRSASDCFFFFFDGANVNPTTNCSTTKLEKVAVKQTRSDLFID